jgi:hypothetical protein
MSTIARTAKVRKTENLVRFADLLAENERERAKQGIAKFCDKFADKYEGKTISSKNLRLLADAIRSIQFEAPTWRNQ